MSKLHIQIVLGPQCLEHLAWQHEFWTGMDPHGSQFVNDFADLEPCRLSKCADCGWNVQNNLPPLLFGTIASIAHRDNLGERGNSGTALTHGCWCLK